MPSLQYKIQTDFEMLDNYVSASGLKHSRYNSQLWSILLFLWFEKNTLANAFCSTYMPRQFIITASSETRHPISSLVRENLVCGS